MPRAYSRAIVMVLACVALFFSLYRLTESPSVWYDEGYYVQSAMNLAQHGVLGMRLEPGSITRLPRLTVSYPLLYPLALALSVFGSNILVARLVMVAFMAGLLAASFSLTRRLFGMSAALWTFALLAVFPPLYGDGKSVLGEVPGLFYLTCFVISLYRARTERHQRLLWSVLAGLCAGLAVATKPVFLLVVPAALLAGLLRWREVKTLAREGVASALAFIPPLLLWAYVQFYGMADSFQGVLGFYANPYQVADLSSIILSNVRHFFTDTGPLFLLVMMVVWMLSLGIRYRGRTSIALEELFLFIFNVLSILAFLRTDGWYRYLFPYQAIALLFFPYALTILVQYAKAAVPRFGRPYAVAIPAVVLSLLFLSSLYQLAFHSWVADSYGSHKTAFWQGYFAALPADATVFFYDTPEVALFDTNERYYQYLTPAGWPPNTDVLPALESGLPDVVIVDTDVLQSAPSRFTSYRITSQPYKYTILQKI